MIHRNAIVLALAISCVVAACGDDDAMVATDSSVASDAGGGSDAGRPLDASVMGDAAVRDDAAAPRDAGGSDASTGSDASVADAGATDAGMRATIEGTLTFPGSAPGRPYGVRLAATPAGVATPLAETSGLTTSDTTLVFSIADVPAGTYFMLAFVDVDSSGGASSTPGDYAGWYGHSGDGNPPPAANVVVPATGTATFDWTLVVR